MFVFLLTAHDRTLPGFFEKYHCEKQVKDQLKQIRWQRRNERAKQSQQNVLLCCYSFQLAFAFIYTITVVFQ